MAENKYRTLGQLIHGDLSEIVHNFRASHAVTIRAAIAIAIIIMMYNKRDDIDIIKRTICDTIISHIGSIT